MVADDLARRLVESPHWRAVTEDDQAVARAKYGSPGPYCLMAWSDEDDPFPHIY